MSSIELSCFGCFSFPLVKAKAVKTCFEDKGLLEAELLLFVV